MNTITISKKDLNRCQDLQQYIIEAVAEEKVLCQKHFSEEIVLVPDAAHFDADTLHFEKCRFVECCFDYSAFRHVKFSYCDFSNCHFEHSYFKQVIFNNCKGIGAVFTNSSFVQTSFWESNFDYAHLNTCKLEKCNLHRSSFSCASVAESKLKSVHLQNSTFDHTDFFKTPLKGLDFSDSVISNILISDDLSELKGTYMDLFQAAEFAKMLGIHIV